MMSKFSYTLLLSVAVLFLPWWLSGFFALFLILYLPWYYQGVIAVIFYELIYGFDLDVLWLSLAYLLAVPVLEFIKTRLYVFKPTS